MGFFKKKETDRKIPGNKLKKDKHRVEADGPNKDEDYSKSCWANLLNDPAEFPPGFTVPPLPTYRGGTRETPAPPSMEPQPMTIEDFNGPWATRYDPVRLQNLASQQAHPQQYQAWTNQTYSSRGPNGQQRELDTPQNRMVPARKPVNGMPRVESSPRRQSHEGAACNLDAEDESHAERPVLQIRPVSPLYHDEEKLVTFAPSPPPREEAEEIARKYSQDWA